jgi:erythromycin esterase-like protein
MQPIIRQHSGDGDMTRSLDADEKGMHTVRTLGGDALRTALTQAVLRRARAGPALHDWRRRFDGWINSRPQDRRGLSKGGGWSKPQRSIFG